MPIRTEIIKRRTRKVLWYKKNILWTDQEIADWCKLSIDEVKKIIEENK